LEGKLKIYSRLVDLFGRGRNDIVIALDSAGIKLANLGECTTHEWHVRRGSEEVRGGKMLKNLDDNASENNNLKAVLVDGMCDSNKNFLYVSKNHIKPGISPEEIARSGRQLIVKPETCR
jgi:hypothetical protein